MNNKSFAPKSKDIKPLWHFIDASNKVLGKAAVDIAKLLMGKNKSTITPNTNMGDKVVVTNASKILVTGKKMEDKVYYRHTDYPKGLRSEKLQELFSRNPSEVLRRAITGMLPKNRLRSLRMKNLYIYPESEHPHTAWEKGSGK